MDPEFATMLRSAATSAWWTLLIGWGVMTVGWLAWLGILKARPKLIEGLLGGIEWEELHRIVLRQMSAMKVALLVLLLLTIWLSFWAWG